jgi:YVTN family beta-propeller protein
VPNRNSQYLNVFDLRARRCVARIPVCSHPDVTATTADGRFLYQAGSYLVAIDLRTLEVVRIYSNNAIRDGYAVNMFPSGERMFYYNLDGSIAVLRHADDPYRLEVEHLIVVNEAPPGQEAAIGGKGHFIDGGNRYVNANWHTNSVFAIDLNDYTVHTLIPSGFSKPDDLVMAPDGHKGYAASHAPGPDGHSDAVHVFDIVDRKVVKAIKVGRQPAGLTMSPDETVVYVTNVPDGSVSAIEVATDAVLFTISAAAAFREAGIVGPPLNIEGVSVSADGSTLYAYAVEYGALVMIEDLGGRNRPLVIPGG